MTINYEVGIRVGVIVSADKDTVRFLGWGTYNGDHTPPTPFGVEAAAFGRVTWEERDRLAQELAAEGRAELVKEGVPEAELQPEGFIPPRPTNPMITLDSGDVAWGHQCWWGPAEKVKEVIAGRRVVEVPFAEFLLAGWSTRG